MEHNQSFSNLLDDSPSPNTPEVSQLHPPTQLASQIYEFVQKNILENEGNLKPSKFHVTQKTGLFSFILLIAKQGPKNVDYLISLLDASDRSKIELILHPLFRIRYEGKHEIDHSAKGFSEDVRAYAWELILTGEFTFCTRLEYSNSQPQQGKTKNDEILQSIQRTLELNPFTKNKENKEIAIFLKTFTKFSKIKYYKESAHIAAVLLYVLDDFTAFRCMLSLHEQKYGIKQLFENNSNHLNINISNIKLLLKTHKTLYNHLKENKFSFRDFYTTCVKDFFSCKLGLVGTLFVWDQFLAIGWETLFNLSLFFIVKNTDLLMANTNFEFKMPIQFCSDEDFSPMEFTNFIIAIEQNDQQIHSQSNLLSPSQDTNSESQDPEKDPINQPQCKPEPNEASKAKNIIPNNSQSETSEENIELKPEVNTRAYNNNLENSPNNLDKQNYEEFTHRNIDSGNSKGEFESSCILQSNDNSQLYIHQCEKKASKHPLKTSERETTFNLILPTFKMIPSSSKPKSILAAPQQFTNFRIKTDLPNLKRRITRKILRPKLIYEFRPQNLIQASYHSLHFSLQEKFQHRDNSPGLQNNNSKKKTPLPLITFSHKLKENPPQYLSCSIYTKLVK